MKRPRLSRVSLSRKRVTAGSRARVRVRFRLSERAKVSVRIERRVRRRWRDVNAFTWTRAAGRRTVAFRARTLRGGRHRVVVRAQDGAHNRSKRVIRRLRVAR